MGQLKVEDISGIPQVVEKHLPHLRLLDLQLRFLTLIKFYLLLIEKT